MTTPAERAAKQARDIHRWKPWEQSTGPRTAAGKAQCATNALKHGGRSRQADALLAAATAYLAEVKG